MAVYESQHRRADDCGYDWRDWLLGVGVLVSGVGSLGTLTWYAVEVFW